MADEPLIVVLYHMVNSSLRYSHFVNLFQHFSFNIDFQIINICRRLFLIIHYSVYTLLACSRHLQIRLESKLIKY